MQKNGVTLLVDPMSYQYLVGAEIDYTEGLEGSQFVIKNPNATSTCGCGSLVLCLTAWPSSTEAAGRAGYELPCSLEASENCLARVSCD